MILTGRYATLRSLTVADAEITQKWRTSGRAYLLNKGAQSVMEQAAWIRQATSRIDAEHFVILTDRRPVGMISLEQIDLTHRRAEPAHFLIGEPEKVAKYGRRVAAEAQRLLFDYAFDPDQGYGLHRLWGPIAVKNDGMLTWQKYLGFTVEGTMKEHYFLNGEWQDAVYVGLLEATYRAITRPKLTALIGG